jgi:cytochrome bd-type quinol oxidase subunit 1
LRDEGDDAGILLGKLAGVLLIVGEVAGILLGILLGKLAAFLLIVGDFAGVLLSFCNSIFYKLYI